MPLTSVSSLQRDCNNLQRSVKLHVGHSLSLASDPPVTETSLRNSYKLAIDLLKGCGASDTSRLWCDGDVVQLHPGQQEHFIFCKVGSLGGTARGRSDTLSFALGTKSWAYQGMVEIQDDLGVGCVEWRFYQPTRRAQRLFGSYRCMAGGSSQGGFCKGELLGSALVLFPRLLLQGGGALQVVPRTPAHLGVVFESSDVCLGGWFSDARCAA
jgi:hypothetical protein